MLTNVPPVFTRVRFPFESYVYVVRTEPSTLVTKRLDAS
jgi:hypothetical protein